MQPVVLMGSGIIADSTSASVWMAAFAVAAAVAAFFLAGWIVAFRKLRKSEEFFAAREADLNSTIQTQAALHLDAVEHTQKTLIEPFAVGRVASFRLTLENDRFSRIAVSGFRAPDELNGLSVEEAVFMVHADDRTAVRTSLIDSMSKKRPLELVCRLNGVEPEQYLYVRGTTVSEADGSTTLIGIACDLTSVVNSQQAAAAWLKTTELMIDRLPCGAWLADADGTIALWNRAMAAITGISTETAVGMPVFSPLFANARPVLDAPAEPEGHVVRVKPDKTLPEDLCRVFRFEMDDHRAGAICGFAVPHANRNDRLPDPQAAEMEALGRLTSEVAHDFANLVHIILGYADILKQDMRAHPVQLDDLGQIVTAGMKAEELVRQILAFCSRDSIHSVRCDLNEVVDGFMGILKRIAGDPVSVRFHPGPGLDSVEVDTSLVRRVLLKLVLKMTASLTDGGLVAVSTRNVIIEDNWPVAGTDMKPGNYVKLSVSCNCAVLPDETDVETEPERAGYRDLMAAAGGFVNVHESSDLGTTVSLYFQSTGMSASAQAETDGALPGDLPRSNQDDSLRQHDLFAAAQSPDASSGRTDQKPRRTILVVEDDAPVRRLTAKALTIAGYRVIEAGDGEEAVRLFDKAPEAIDLLITDVIMPGLNGRQVFDRLKAVRPDLPVLFCSGYSSDLLQNEYMLNIQGLVIQKPYRSSELIEAAERLVGSSRSMDSREA